jgi:hypothetical protein
MRSQSAVGLDIAVDQLRIRISRRRLVGVHELGGWYRVGAGGGRDLEVAKALRPTLLVLLRCNRPYVFTHSRHATQVADSPILE